METNGNGTGLLKLAVNAPVCVALKYAGAGKRGVSPKSGEEYVMFTWADGTRSFVDAAGGEQIEALGLQPREVFTLVKRPKGRWEVARGEALREMRAGHERLPAEKFAAPAPNSLPGAASGGKETNDSTLARLERAVDAFCAAWGRG